jgi:hypothetical protein
MSTLIGALRVTMGLDSAQYERGTARTRRDTARTSTEIKRHFSSMRSTVAGFFAAVSAGAVIALIDRQLQYAASLGEVSQQLGITTRDLQVYRYAATQVNLEQEEVERSLARLSLAIGRAGAGSREQARIFRMLRIDIRGANGELKTAGDIMPDLADAIMGIENPTSRAAVLVELFGRAGQRLLPLLKDGSGALRAFAADAERMGIVLSDDAIQRADVTADRLEALKMALSARISGIVIDNAEAILTFAEGLARLASGIATFLSSNPERMLGILGAMAGLRLGRVGGLPGMILGGVGGYLAGEGLGNHLLGEGTAAESTDIGARRTALQEAVRRNRAFIERRGTARRSRGGIPGLAEMFEEVGGLGPDSPEGRAAYREVQRQTRLLLAARSGSSGASAPTATGDDLELGDWLAPDASESGRPLRDPDEIIRAIGGTVTSGARTPAQNRAAGGDPDSFHLSNRARDVGLSGMSRERLRAAFEAEGYDVAELLGPGDPGHDDHYHIAWRNQNGRRGQDAARRAAEQAAEREAEEAERQRREALQRAHQRASEIADADLDILRQRQSMSTDAEERAHLERHILDAEREQERAALALAVQLGDMTETEALARGERIDQLHDLKVAGVAQEQLRDRLEASWRLEDERFRLKSDGLSAELDLADTAQERRRLELELLALGFRERATRLKRIIADEQASRADRDAAGLEISGLADEYGRARAGVMRGTRTPLEEFLAALPTTAARTDEALESIAANGMSSLNDGLAEMLTNIRGIGDAWRVMGQIGVSVLRSLIQTAIQRGTAPLAERMLGWFGGAASVTISGSGKAAGAGKSQIGDVLNGLPKFAGGGSLKIAGMSGVDTNLLSLNHRPIAWVNRGESLDITPAGGGGRGGRPIFKFDFRGAVVTQDLLNEMNAIGSAAMEGGAQLATVAAAKRGARRLGGRGKK